jgi:hypothetical protein
MKKTPALVIAFNQLSYVRNMVSQLEKYPSIEIIIADNNSSYQPLLDWYETCPHRVLRFSQNHNNTVYRLPEVQAILGNMTDAQHMGLRMTELLTERLAKEQGHCHDEHCTHDHHDHPHPDQG